MTAYIVRDGDKMPSECVFNVVSVQELENTIMVFHRINNDVIGYKVYNKKDNQIMLTK